MAFLRFVLHERSEESGQRIGFLRGAQRALESGRLTGYEEARLQEIFAWFNANVPVPDRLSRKRHNYHKNKHGLSWFKDSAKESLELAREVVEILKQNGVTVETVVTKRPGFVVYEDDLQVVAEPFSDSGA